MRNREFTILKALGIILVVSGHTSTAFPWFPQFSFHLALFFFISGYFYKVSYESQPLQFIRKRFLGLMVPYFAYNLFFGVITYILIEKYAIPAGQVPTLFNFFISPFLIGNQYGAFAPAWFVPALLIVQIVFLFLFGALRRLTPSSILQFAFFLLLALLGIALGNQGNNQGIMRVVDRTLFSLLFFYSGYLYKQVLERKPIFTTPVFAFVLLLQLFLYQRYGGFLDYILFDANFEGRLLAPIITSFTGIYVTIFFAKAITSFFPKRDFLDTIGENTLHIMSTHLLVFFLINLSFYFLFNLNRTVLYDFYYIYNHDWLWPYYTLLGVLLPTLIVVGVQKLRLRVTAEKKPLSGSSSVTAGDALETAAQPQPAAGPAEKK